MKASFTVIIAFALGIALGAADIIDQSAIPDNISTYLLYILVLQVGLGIGASDNFDRLRHDINLKAFLIPFGTIAGTLIFVALAGYALGGIALPDYLAIGSGFGYYSMSSALIIELKEPTLGMQTAAKLGTMALLANICRELTSLCFAPFLARHFGKYGLIAASGVTSVDVLLPSIIKYSGKEMIPAAIINSLVLEISVPILVAFFCAI